MSTEDKAQWRVTTTVDKWTPEQVASIGETDEPITGDVLWQRVGPPADSVISEGNMLLDAGQDRVSDLLIGAGGQVLNEAATRMGVGNSTTAEDKAQTDLQAPATDKWFQTMDAGYPQLINGTATFRATFAADDANFDWAEWGLDVNTPPRTASNAVGGVLVNRKVVPMGTKVAGAVWTLTTTLTIG